MTAELVDTNPVDKAWRVGVALGRILATHLGTDKEREAVTRIAQAKAVSPRATDPIKALANCHSLNVEVRCDVARGSGILVGWALGTDGRADRTECAACGAALVTDAEPHEVCASLAHGLFCDVVCKDARCRSTSCDDQGRDR